MHRPTLARTLGAIFSFLLIIYLQLFSGSAPTQAFAAPLGNALDLLFAPPTSAEIEAVRNDWATRPTAVTNTAIDRSANLDGFRMDRVSFHFEGLKQYGMVRYPRNFSPDEKYPVLMLLHGGFDGLWYDFPLHFDDNFPTACLADDFFIVSPTYRGEAFSGGELGNVFSEGEPSCWNRDCDDSMAMLTATLGLISEADGTRVAAQGHSRGGNVAYQMAVRDPRISRTAVLFGPSQFREPGIRAEIDAEVDGSGEAQTGPARKLFQVIVQPLLAGQMELAEARHLLTIWSVCDFLEADLHISSHHGLADDAVPPVHSTIVEAHMQSVGAEDFELHTYENGVHNPDSLNGYEELLESLFCGMTNSLSPVPLPGARGQLQTWPNPFHGRLELGLQLSDKSKSPDGEFIAGVYDLRGRLVASIKLLPGQKTTWQAVDNLGQSLPSGTYFLRISGQPNLASARILLLR
ncbi:MAG: hypothetical protein GY780_17550 [bacterium]|nr:hypothetical protein [bacterium]